MNEKQGEKMNIDDLTLGQIKEIQRMAQGSIKTEPTRISKGAYIVVLQRSWVYVGNLFKEGENYILENAKNIRVWGTTKGLGELINGPLDSTKLDSCGTVEFHELVMVNLIKVDDSKWKKELLK